MKTITHFLLIVLLLFSISQSTLANGNISLSSSLGTDNQTVCKNTSINNITYNTGTSMGVTFQGLPPGVEGLWSSGTAIISGKPSVAGTFTYSISTANNSISGVIRVNEINAISLDSHVRTINQDACINTPIEPVIFKITGTIANIAGLPNGITYTFADSILTISGTPTELGTTFYSINLTDGCGTISGNGAIHVIGEAPSGKANQSFCTKDNPTVANIVTNGTNLKWRITPTEGSVLPENTPLSDNTRYYGTQTINGCESTTRIEVLVSLFVCSGIDSQAQEIKITTSESTIQIIGGVEPNSKVEIYGSDGSIKGQYILNNSNFNSIQTNLPKGIYIILIKSEQNQISSKIIL